MFYANYGVGSAYSSNEPGFDHFDHDPSSLTPAGGSPEQYVVAGDQSSDTQDVGTHPGHTYSAFAQSHDRAARSWLAAGMNTGPGEAQQAAYFPADSNSYDYSQDGSAQGGYQNPDLADHSFPDTNTFAHPDAHASVDTYGAEPTMTPYMTPTGHGQSGNMPTGTWYASTNTGSGGAQHFGLADHSHFDANYAGTFASPTTYPTPYAAQFDTNASGSTGTALTDARYPGRSRDVATRSWITAGTSTSSDRSQQLQLSGTARSSAITQTSTSSPLIPALRRLGYTERQLNQFLSIRDNNSWARARIPSDLQSMVEHTPALRRLGYSHSQILDLLYENEYLEFIVERGGTEVEFASEKEEQLWRGAADLASQMSGRTTDQLLVDGSRQLLGNSARNSAPRQIEEIEDENVHENGNENAVARR